VPPKIQLYKHLLHDGNGLPGSHMQNVWSTQLPFWLSCNGHAPVSMVTWHGFSCIQPSASGCPWFPWPVHLAPLTALTALFNSFNCSAINCYVASIINPTDSDTSCSSYGLLDEGPVQDWSSLLTNIWHYSCVWLTQ
jgi:hypothetical protein